MKERTHLFIKIYLSHFIPERVDVGCVWDHSSTSSSFCLGLLNSTVGHWGPQALSLQADSHAGILTPTDSNCNWPKPSVAPGYIIPLFLLLFTLVRLLIDGLAKGQYIKKKRETKSQPRNK